MAATVPVETPGQISPLLEAAQRIGEPDDRPSTDDTNHSSVFDPESPPDIDMPAGSFEAFMGSFGTPGRWAGSN